MDVWLPALVGALAGLAGGWCVPRLIAWCPEPEADPDENPDEFPDHVRFADLAARHGLGLRCALASAIAGAVLGAFIGWGWALLWLLPLVPVFCALTVIDYVTWYLPKKLVLPSYALVAALEVVAAVVLGEPELLAWAAGGFLALGTYYGLLWFISPRMMAFGDVRLGALIGLALGPLGVGTLLVSVFAAAVIGVLGMLPMRRTGTMIRRHVPYGPFLVLGALAAVVVGQVLAQR